MAQQNFTPIVVRGNFLYDPYFASARATIEQLVRDIQGVGTGVAPSSANRPTPGLASGPTGQIYWPPDNMTELMSLISKWQQIEASQGTTHFYAMPDAPMQQSTPSLNTIFHFDIDAFQMFVDVRGYHPSEIRVSVSASMVEVRVCHEDCDLNAVSANYASRTISKVYRLPRSLTTEKAQCSLSADGTLIVYAPWSQH